MLPGLCSQPPCAAQSPYREAYSEWTYAQPADDFETVSDDCHGQHSQSFGHQMTSLFVVARFPIHLIQDPRGHWIADAREYADGLSVGGGGSVDPYDPVWYPMHVGPIHSRIVLSLSADGLLSGSESGQVQGSWPSVGAFTHLTGTGHWNGTETVNLTTGRDEWSFEAWFAGSYVWRAQTWGALRTCHVSGHYTAHHSAVDLIRYDALQQAPPLEACPGGQAPASAEVKLAVHPQRQSNWCWAAVAQMLMEHAAGHEDPQYQQCSQASAATDPYGCCPDQGGDAAIDPSLPAPLPRGCNHPGNVHASLSRFGFVDQRLGAWSLPSTANLTPQFVREQIACHDSPIGIVIAGAQPAFHELLITGYDTRGSETMLRIYDPAYYDPQAQGQQLFGGNRQGAGGFTPPVPLSRLYDLGGGLKLDGIIYAVRPGP